MEITYFVSILFKFGFKKVLYVVFEKHGGTKRPSNNVTLQPRLFVAQIIKCSTSKIGKDIGFILRYLYTWQAGGFLSLLRLNLLPYLTTTTPGFLRNHTSFAEPKSLFFEQNWKSRFPKIDKSKIAFTMQKCFILSTKLDGWQLKGQFSGKHQDISDYRFSNPSFFFRFVHFTHLVGKKSWNFVYNFFESPETRKTRLDISTSPESPPKSTFTFEVEDFSRHFL